METILLFQNEKSSSDKFANTPCLCFTNSVINIYLFQTHNQETYQGNKAK